MTCSAICQTNGRRCESAAGHTGPHDFIGVPHQAAQPGLLPLGTVLPGFGTIVEVSLTAYRVEWSEPCPFGSYRRSEWLPFHQVHGQPSPVMPLVVFG